MLLKADYFSNFDEFYNSIGKVLENTCNSQIGVCQLIDIFKTGFDHDQIKYREIVNYYLNVRVNSSLNHSSDIKKVLCSIFDLTYQAGACALSI